MTVLLISVLKTGGSMLNPADSMLIPVREQLFHPNAAKGNYDPLFCRKSTK
ncbi:hypothetical protein GCM10008018_22430 [Paenibacillus marchantiophytorum]|uniref:Uncharacterized protein n=1 Tax=Paenibacillus marchantiophytorum TaxID=1619310 RepID=A0ABQ1EKV6_9BACL|nr:hypothetical protein GCM10008018_22430 [Paenibacillus marchantiophytorum]